MDISREEGDKGNDPQGSSEKPIEIERVKVESSNISTIGYNEEHQILDVQFKGASAYRFTGVPKNIHEQLMAAESKGKAFNSLVKTKYPFKKI